MRNQNSTGLRSDTEYVEVGSAEDATLMSTLEIDGRLPSAKAKYDFVVEIGVRL